MQVQSRPALLAFKYGKLPDAQLDNIVSIFLASLLSLESPCQTKQSARSLSLHPPQSWLPMLEFKDGPCACKVCAFNYLEKGCSSVVKRPIFWYASLSPNRDAHMKLSSIVSPPAHDTFLVWQQFSKSLFPSLAIWASLF